MERVEIILAFTNLDKDMRFSKFNDIFKKLFADLSAESVAVKGGYCIILNR